MSSSMEKKPSDSYPASSLIKQKRNDNPTCNSPLMIQLSDPFSHGVGFVFCSFSFLVSEFLITERFVFSRMKKLSVPLLTLILMVSYTLWQRAFKRLTQGTSLSAELKYSTDFSGVTAIVTGGSSGIGKTSVIQLLDWGATVIVGIRDLSKADEIRNEIEKVSLGNGDKLCFYTLVLDNMESVKKFAETVLGYKHNIHLLINNAGIMAPETCTLSHLGLDPQFTTNHLGHFLLTTLLLSNIKKNNGRIINVSSSAHSFLPTKDIDIKKLSKPNPEKYNTSIQYAFSKMCNIWFTRELQNRLDEDSSTTATTYTCHPGVIKTNLSRDCSYMIKTFINATSTFMKTTQSGASTQLFLAAEPKENLKPGCYYSNSKIASVLFPALDDSLAKELWDYSEELVLPYKI